MQPFFKRIANQISRSKYTPTAISNTFGPSLSQASRSYSSSMSIPASKLAALEAYSACDIADALLKLNVPGAGFLPDILPLPLPNSSSTTTTKRIIAPATTILFTPRSSPSFPNPSPATTTTTTTPPAPPSVIPAGTPYADLVPPHTIAVLSQPRGQACAVLGGIMAMRLRRLRVRAVLVDGRVRDLGTLGEVMRGGVQLGGEQGGGEEGMPVWARGTSVIGAGAETRAWAVGGSVEIGATVVNSGDIVMIDPTERGAVVIPVAVFDKVLELLPKLTDADAKVIKDVEEGMTVAEAFKLHRGK